MRSRFLKSLVVLTMLAGVAIAGSIGGFKSPDGKENMNCPLPGNLHQRNTVGSDGSGLCVYASARHTGRWQDEQLFIAIFDWMKQHPGGSYPDKFKRTLLQCAQEKGLPVPNYIQLQDADIEILKTACQNGFMPGVTYGYSPTGRYNGKRIAHMVSLVHASNNWFAVLDNNYPGEQNFEWLSPQEFKGAHVSPNGIGWKVILLTTPPPPKPRYGTKIN